MELISPTRTAIWRATSVWVSLLCILAVFVIAIVRLHPTNFFGYTEDDSIYFSSAKALAQGDGYVLPSFPGTPAATKYPVLYPWILSWVWRLNPSFPANLPDAIAVTVMFGIVYVAAAFFFLRGLRGLSDLEALLLTAFCALHPLILFYSSNVLSEIPFAAMTLVALLVAERAVRRDASDSTVVFCAILVGLASLTRMFGIPIAFGILIAMFINRTKRNALVYCVSLAPFFAGLAWRVISPKASISFALAATGSSTGWIHTWAYYTNYLDVWRQGVPTVRIFLAMLANNALWLLRTPADYFTYPLLDARTPLECITMLLITAAVIGGILREAHRKPLRPIHLAFPFYAVLILLWNYPQVDRFLIPFMPLIAAGLWLEGKNLIRLILHALHGEQPWTERLVAGMLSFLVLVLFFAVTFNYLNGTRTIEMAKSKERAALLNGKQQAYQWLAHSTPPGTRVVAYEDATLYLYSERAAVRPFTFTTAELYDPKRLPEDLGHITDVARAIDADYWVVANDDYEMEWPDAYAKSHARMRELTSVLPVVFRSTDSDVRIFSLDCVRQPDAPSCEPAKRILFPDRTSTLGSLIK